MADREGFKRSSELLLGGWKMLAICCPICKMPLFSKAEDVRCAGCDLPVKLESQTSEEASGSTSATAPKEQPSSDEQLDAGMAASTENEEVEEGKEEAAVAYEDMKRAYADRRRQSDTASAKVGAKLLQGWTMLSSTCSNAECSFSPLMRSAPSEPMTCVVCDRCYSIDASGTAVALGPKAFAAPPATLPPTPSTSEGWLDMRSIPTLPPSNIDYEDASHSVEDQSGKIAKLLLNGWTMLADSCASGCSAPLMRHPNGQTHCVSCRHQTAAVAVSHQAFEEASDDDENASDDEVAAKVERLTRSAVAKSTAAPTSTTTTTSVVHEASTLLEQRLARAASDLRLEEDLQIAAQQADLVQHLATALRALDELSFTRQKAKKRGW